jgi:hypothetical protein
VHHAVDVVVEPDEQTELGDVLDLALDLRALGMGLGEDFPRVAHGLLEAERHAALGGVDLQHHDLDLLGGGDDLAGMHVLLGPGHLGDVHETLDARLQLHEGTVVGDVGDAARYAPMSSGYLASTRSHGSSCSCFMPRLMRWVSLLILMTCTLTVSPIDRISGVVDAAPGHVGDVQQAVDTAEVHEGAVFGDVLDHAVHDVAFGELADDLGALFGAGFFEDRAARDDDVAAAAVHLEDLERLLEAHQRAGVAHGAHIDLRAGQERHGAAQIDGEAALDAAEDRAFDALFVGIGFFQTVPGFFAAGHLAADDGFAARVLDARR